MAGNKHALTRYRVLDACFSNWIRKYYAEDLIAKCNEALAERYPSGDVGISRRTFFDDLNDLDEIVGGYGVEIKRLHDGRKKDYRYDKEPWRSRGLRRMAVDNYCVFYIPDNDARTVEIIRVMYGGRDIDRRMAEYADETE